MRPFEFGDASLNISHDAYVSPSLVKSQSPDVQGGPFSRKFTPSSSFVTAHVTALICSPAQNQQPKLPAKLHESRCSSRLSDQF
jgi:hypothetical protein